MSKAYDRVEWSFIEGVMIRKMGFLDNWIELIIKCISMASFLVLINGEPRGNIQPQRGLRQGCPLSPYLFLLCREALSALILKAESDITIHGLKITSRCPSISHLFFANDSLLFLRANREEAMMVVRILEQYEKPLGQTVNFHKSALIVSPTTSEGQIEELKRIFKMGVVECHSQYLGLSSTIGRNKRDVFDGIRERVMKRLAGWQEKLFSVGGVDQSCGAGNPDICNVFI